MGEVGDVGQTASLRSDRDVLIVGPLLEVLICTHWGQPHAGRDFPSSVHHDPHFVEARVSNMLAGHPPSGMERAPVPLTVSPTTLWSR